MDNNTEILTPNVENKLQASQVEYEKDVSMGKTDNSVNSSKWYIQTVSLFFSFLVKYVKYLKYVVSKFQRWTRWRFLNIYPCIL